MTTCIKCVTIGEGGVGKTSLLITYATGAFPVEYIPTVFDNHNVTLSVDDKSVYLSLWDIFARLEDPRFRSLTYPNTDVILLLFSVAWSLSFDSIKDKWLKEIAQYCPDVAIILVGTKTDLRDDTTLIEDPRKRRITFKEGLQMANEIGAVKYLECSSVKMEGVVEVFHEVVRQGISAKNSTSKAKAKAKGKCFVL